MEPEQTPESCPAPAAQSFRCIVIVGFDLNEGQVINYVHPPDSLPEPFLKSLASIAFPDTSSFSAEGELFYFLKLLNGAEHLFCYIVFNQRRDPSNKRGYFQSSTIVVSPTRAITVMKSLVTKLNSIFYLSKYQTALLDEFYADLATKNPSLLELLDGESFAMNFFQGQMKVCFKRVRRPQPRLLPRPDRPQATALGVPAEGQVIRS